MCLLLATLVLIPEALAIRGAVYNGTNIDIFEFSNGIDGNDFTGL